MATPNCNEVVMQKTVVEKAFSIGTCDGSIDISAQQIQDVVDGHPPGGGPIVTNYRSSYETDGYVYAGYLLNLAPTITRTKDAIFEEAQGLTDLETDWTNRLSLTYI